MSGGITLNILITGGTGFIGRNLIKSFQANNHRSYILTRFPDNYTDTNDEIYISYDHPVAQLPTIHTVINLAGESLFGYWSKRKREAILNSRIDTTNNVIEIIKKLHKRPDVFISGSAVGYYGTSEDLMFTEVTEKPGEDFLASVVVQWEKYAKQVEEMGIRIVYTRFGVVLGVDGALPYMSLPVKLFAGGKIGDGEQWISWIHIEDAIKLINFCIANEHINGSVNITAPNPRRNKDFMKKLAKVLKRPYWFPTPSPLIHAVMGEMSQLITKGQYVLPNKSLDAGFQFSYPNLEEALKEIAQKGL